MMPPYVPPSGAMGDISWVGDPIYRAPLGAYTYPVSFTTATAAIVFRREPLGSMPIALIFGQGITTKRWTGTEWVVARVRKYNGTGWVDAAVKIRYTDAWA